MNVWIRNIAVVLAAAIGCFASPAARAADSPQQTELKGLVGTWNCTSHMGNQSFHETDVISMWGPWLKDEAAFAGGGGEPAGNVISFIGYDAKKSRWYFTTLDTTGEYGSSYSTSKTYGGSKWTAAYPQDGSSASVTTSKNQYAVDVTYHGAVVHQVCTRA